MSATTVLRFVHRRGWVLALFVLLGLLLVVTRIIQPDYGAAGFGSLVRAVLPFAFAVAAQTVVVIGGGVDLSVASMMALTSVTAAVLMSGASEEFAILVVPAVLLLGLGDRSDQRSADRADAGTRHRRDALHAVRLAGRRPAGAGGSRRRLGALADGPCGRHCAVAGRVRGDRGISPERAGSPDRLPVRDLDSAPPLTTSAFRSTPSAATASQPSAAACRSTRTKIAAYSLAGLFAAMGGLVLTASTGIGAPIPGPYLLASVAAVVLGGVTLGGGRGGLLGPIVAVFILRLVRSDLTFLAVDPNVTTIIEGTIMVIVVMLGAFFATRGRSA